MLIYKTISCALENDVSNEDGSDSVYKPSDSENGSSDVEPDEIHECVENSFESSLILNFSFNIPGNSACDDNQMCAELSKGAKGEQKKNYCLFCKQPQSKIARHLENKHQNEESVMAFCTLKKGSLERKNAIAVLRKKGNFLFNVKQDLNNGILVPTRRPRTEEKRSGKCFTACPNCKGFYTKNNIRHHYAACTGKVGSKGVLSKARCTIGRIHEQASKVMRHEIIPVMREDEIVRLIRYDFLIIKYGNQLCMNYRKKYLHKMIRAKLRLLGRFLKKLKEIESSIIDFASLFDPKHYDKVVDAINAVVGLNEETGMYESASNAAELTKSIKRIGRLLVTECIKSHDSEKQQNTENFLKLCETGFPCTINRTVMESLVAAKRRKVVRLPKTEDIIKLNRYLDNIIDIYYKKLLNMFSVQIWRTLAEALLVRIQTFNRRRPGEIERLYISDFKNTQSVTEEDEGYKCLSLVDKRAAKEYVRIEIRGKLNRTVPILLNSKMRNGIDIILKYRQKAGVSSKNPYVFGISGQDKESFLSATKLIRTFAGNCGATNPESLRGTPLRKHAATKCAEFQLDENEISNFAKFMGHDIQIHKNIYRQPVAKVDILGISHILEKAQDIKKADISSENSGLISFHQF